MKNVALHKPANQSYTYVDPGNSEAWVAGRAVDDCLIRNPYTPPYCCSATLADTNNYWHLNLQDEYQVQRIVIYGRTESKFLAVYYITQILIFNVYNCWGGAVDIRLFLNSSLNNQM